MFPSFKILVCNVIEETGRFKICDNSLIVIGLVWIKFKIAIRSFEPKAWHVLYNSSAEAAKTADFKISFDPTLVRGMSYYTGPIFEIAMDEFGGSVGGGGRYDEMIGKFTGQNTPACGFSIGFERIVLQVQIKLIAIEV